MPGALTVTAGCPSWSTASLAPTTIRGVGPDHAALAVGAVLLAIFVFIEARFAPHPLVPLGIFRRRTLSAANGIAVTIGRASSACTSSSALPAGGQRLPPANRSRLLAGWSLHADWGIRGARWSRHRSPAQLVLGLGRLRLAFLLSVILAGDAYLAHVLGPAILIGIGIGMSFGPMTLSATVRRPPPRGGAGLGRSLPPDRSAGRWAWPPWPLSLPRSPPTNSEAQTTG